LKGVILAGGTGSRLMPLTKVTNKHLLPVYKKPMIYYPIEKLVEMGVSEIFLVCGKEHVGDFVKLLGSGKEFGVNFTYEIQETASGIADALRLAEDFVDGEKFAVILGDNIFEDSFKGELEKFCNGKEEARIFLKEVPDAHRFGVAELNGDIVLGIEEKPAKPKSSFAVTGLYMYDGSKVFDVIAGLKPSKRGEYEITDVNNYFAKKGTLKATFLKGFWSDAGTFASYFRATRLLMEKDQSDCSA